MPLAALYRGAALYLLAHVWFKHFLVGIMNVARIAVAVLLVALTPVMALVPALVSLSVLTVVATALVAYETHHFREQRRTVRHGEVSDHG